MGAQLQMASYPGLITSAEDLWRKFLTYYESEFFLYDYNVRVGQGIVAPAYLTDDEKALWKKLTQKRIDVVAERLGQTWIFEIAERPGLREVGQLIGYAHLAQSYLQLKGQIVLAVICARLGHDMAGIFRAQNVLVFLFPPAGAPSFPPSFIPPAPSPAAQV